MFRHDWITVVHWERSIVHSKPRRFLMTSRQKGFTLVNLMIVILIISPLAIIATVNFKLMQREAIDAKTEASMRIFQLAAEDYGVVNDNNFATSDDEIIPLILPHYLDKQGKRMRNAVTKKFTEPSNASSPGSIRYTCKPDNTYEVSGIGADGKPLNLILSGGTK